MGNLMQEQLAALIANVVSQVMQGQTASPKAAGSAKPSNSLEAKDRALVAGFVRKGIKREDVKLMDRANPAAEYNVKPFRVWLEQGMQVRRGEKSIRGLFHRSQVDPIAPKAQPKAKPLV